MSKKSRSDGLKKAIVSAGSVAELARRLDLSRAAVAQWNEIPAKWIVIIEKETGVPREDLRPELYADHSTAA